LKIRIENSKGEEITIDHQVKITCPITLTPLKYPVKGDNCKHLTCFDLQNYLVMNQKAKTFKCPVCNLKTF